MADVRTEHDALGAVALPADALYGTQTARALENFPLSNRPVHAELVHAYGEVKLACARTNRRLGAWAEDPEKADAIERACSELAAGDLDAHIVVDALQGGAGTSTNFNVNEVLAGRALQLLQRPPDDAYVSPADDLNLHQSTNDTFPTALKLAAIRLLQTLEERVVALQEGFQQAEHRFAHIVKLGRTQYQDAVLTTLGREMSAYADAIGRDRWRLFKCQERLRVINLGGTAIGTGLGAPRQFIFQATEELRALTGIGFARAENLVDVTQNADVYAEVSGILKAHAVTLLKICGDLRLLSSGPEGGIGEIRLPPRQAGSTIMPGKTNPVIPEAVSQVAMHVMGSDSVIASACAAGSLELNPFLPLIALHLLESIELSANADDILLRHTVNGLSANETRCRALVENATATITALIPALGYKQAEELVLKATSEGRSVRDLALESGLLDAATFDERVTPEAVCRLGSPDHCCGNHE